MLARAKVVISRLMLNRERLGPDVVRKLSNEDDAFRAKALGWPMPALLQESSSEAMRLLSRFLVTETGSVSLGGRLLVLLWASIVVLTKVAFAMNKSVAAVGAIAVEMTERPGCDTTAGEANIAILYERLLTACQ